MSSYDRLGQLVPAGYEIVETDEIDRSRRIELYPLRSMAGRRCDDLNEAIDTPLRRYVLERLRPELRRSLGYVPWLARWAVVAKTNVLRRESIDT